MFREAYETFREAFREAFRECLQVLRIVRHDSTNGLLNVLESRAIHPYVVRCGYQRLPAHITILTKRTSDADLHTSTQLRQLFCAWQVTAFYAIARSTVKLRPA